MQRTIRVVLLIGLTLTVGLLPGVAAGEGKGVIHGLLYISPPGDLSYDVMFGRHVEVLLVKGKGLQAELQALKESRLPHIRAQAQTAAKARLEFRRARRTEKEQQKRQELERQAARVRELRTAYEKEVDALIARHLLQKMQTDQEGKFRFQALPAGHYLLHAQFQVLRTHLRYHWLYPVDLQDGEAREVHLNKPAAIQLYYGQ